MMEHQQYWRKARTRLIEGIILVLIISIVYLNISWMPAMVLGGNAADLLGSASIQSSTWLPLLLGLVPLSLTIVAIPYSRSKRKKD
jgi:hypothetical protein